MTVSTTNTRAELNGNGSAGPFQCGFRVLANSDLEVYVDGVLKSLTTHYTVANAGTTTNATVTFTSGNFPASGTANVVLVRNVPNTQTSDYQNNTALDAETLETSFDRGTMQIQQLSSGTDRALKFGNSATGISASVTEITSPAATRANKLISFDADGDIQVTQEIGTYKGNWATGTVYVQRDLVKQASSNDSSTKDNIYICIEANTSTGTHLTQNDTAKWTLILDVATASGGVAESADWARKVDGIVTASSGSNDYSSRAYAIGGTGVTDTAGKGSAKDWATKAEDSKVDTSEYSAKHYSAKASASASSASTSASTATNYATKVDGAVTGSNYSAQAWAVGGTGVTDTASRGSAKEWATAPEDDLVDTSEYSAKHYSIKASASATSAAGSATSATNTAVRFLSNKSSDPSTRDPDGSGATLVAGDIYFNTSNNDLHIYTGSGWEQLDTTLPSQSGQSGKFLTTNGSALSWAESASSDQIELTNAVTLSAETITYQKMYLGNTFTVAGNLIVNGNLVLGKIIADSTAQTLSGAGGYSITGTGTLTIGATLT